MTAYDKTDDHKLLAAIMACRPGELVDPIERPAWHATAACRGEDPGMFHPTRDDDGKAWLAKAVCARCDHRLECVEEGMSLPARIDRGIRGGTTATERRRQRP